MYAQIVHCNNHNNHIYCLMYTLNTRLHHYCGEKWKCMEMYTSWIAYFIFIWPSVVTWNFFFEFVFHQNRPDVFMRFTNFGEFGTWSIKMQNVQKSNWPQKKLLKRCAHTNIEMLKRWLTYDFIPWAQFHHVRMVFVDIITEHVH